MSLSFFFLYIFALTSNMQKKKNTKTAAAVIYVGKVVERQNYNNNKSLCVRRKKSEITKTSWTRIFFWWWWCEICSSAGRWMCEREGPISFFILFIIKVFIAKLLISQRLFSCLSSDDNVVVANAIYEPVVVCSTIRFSSIGWNVII